MDKPHKQWIGSAIRHAGALTKQAKQVGMTPLQFARKHSAASGVTGQRARLALTLNKLRKK